jgi:hypothetical protein
MIDQKIIDFISFIALTSVMVERITEVLKTKIIQFIKPDDNKLTIQLLTILVGTGLIALNFDTFVYPTFLNQWIAAVFVVAGSSAGSSMWNDILSAIQNKKLTTIK